MLLNFVDKAKSSLLPETLCANNRSITSNSMSSSLLDQGKMSSKGWLQTVTSTYYATGAGVCTFLLQCSIEIVSGLAVCVVSKLTFDVFLPILRLTNMTCNGQPRKNAKHDIISSGILIYPHVVELVNDFRRNYGRWVLLPPLIHTDEHIRLFCIKSRLMLTNLSLRYLFNDKEHSDRYVRKPFLYSRVLAHLCQALKESVLRYTIK